MIKRRDVICVADPCDSARFVFLRIIFVDHLSTAEITENIVVNVHDCFKLHYLILNNTIKCNGVLMPRKDQSEESEIL